MKERNWVEREKCDGASFDVFCHEFRSFLGPAPSREVPFGNFDVGLYAARRLQKTADGARGGIEGALRRQFRQLERLQ